MDGWLRWVPGRQGTGYERMLLLGSSWPVPFDLYLIRYRVGSGVPPHRDPVDGMRHRRLNVVLRHARRGGIFSCSGRPFRFGRRLCLFRPDLDEHSVSVVEDGSRLVLSLGWALRN